MRSYDANISWLSLTTTARIFNLEEPYADNLYPAPKKAIRYLPHSCDSKGKEDRQKWEVWGELFKTDEIRD